MAIAQMYCSRYEIMRAENEGEIKALKHSLTERRDEGMYDDADRAEFLRRQSHTMGEIARRQDEIVRITEVLTLLKKGWDGTCVVCENESVLLRLALGVPTTRCRACQHEEETHYARTRTFPRGGMLHMPIRR